jgi:hypothetical protein
MSVSPVAGGAAGNQLGHRMAASRQLVDDDPALTERRPVLLLPTLADRKAALVELSLTAGASAAKVAGRFLKRFASLFADKPAAELPPRGRFPAPFGAGLRRRRPWSCLRPIAALRHTATTFWIWPDYVLRPHLDQSLGMITANAAQSV